MANQKQTLIQRAGELFMRLGIRSVTMDEIASCMGMSKKTLYKHVENKDDLINQFILTKLEEDLHKFERIKEETTDAIQEMLAIAQHVVETLRKVSPAVMHDLQKYHKESWREMEAYRNKHIYTQIKDNIERGQREGVYRTDFEIDIITRIYVGMTSLLVFDDIFPNEAYAKDKIADEFIRYHIHGIASAKGEELYKLYTNNRTN